MSFVDVPAPHGRLEALYWAVERPRGAAVVCHPHPLHGGTLHNHVTYRVAAALRDAGFSALRFNFRGVGRSTGSYDDGRGERDDARCALDWLATQAPLVPLWTAGFSFGSRVALRLGIDDARVERVLAVGLAVDVLDFSFVTELAKPAAFLHGDRDEFGGLPKVRELLAQRRAPTRLFVVPDCDHLATGRLSAFAAAAKEAVDWLAAA